MKICKHCGNEITSKDGKLFCSRSCAASFNNKIPKRKKTQAYICDICGAKAEHRRKLCIDCKNEGIRGDITLKEAVYEYLHKSSAYALVRTRARAKTKNREQKCNKCGYDKHVEVCHIKSISEFSEDTKLSVINSDDNLILLCPNCH